MYTIPGGPLMEGTPLIFKGRLINKEDRWVVNLYTTRGHIALHFNPRPKDETIVLNSAIPDGKGWKWDKEVRMHFPETLIAGDDFTLIIIVKHNLFTFQVAYYLEGSVVIFCCSNIPYGRMMRYSKHLSLNLKFPKLFNPNTTSSPAERTQVQGDVPSS